jgi:hypothetical protein
MPATNEMEIINTLILVFIKYSIYYSEMSVCRDAYRIDAAGHLAHKQGVLIY